MSRRISTVAWAEQGERGGWFLGSGWAGLNDKVRLRLSDKQADGVMPDAFVVRLPRRCVMDWTGRVYLSEADYRESIRLRIANWLASGREIY